MHSNSGIKILNSNYPKVGGGGNEQLGAKEGNVENKCGEHYGDVIR